MSTSLADFEGAAHVSGVSPDHLCVVATDDPLSCKQTAIMSGLHPKWSHWPQMGQIRDLDKILVHFGS